MGARLVTAAVAIPAVVAIVSWAPAWGLRALVLALVVVAMRELETLAAARAVRVYPILGTVGAMALATASHSGGVYSTAPALAALTLLVLSRPLAGDRPLEEAMPSAAATLLGALWIGHGASYFAAIRDVYEAGNLYTLFLAVWGGDSFAYFTGRLVGRTKLAPTVSPKKTVEGLLGGLAGSVAGVLVGQRLVAPALRMGLPESIALGVVIGLVATLGDLAESALKRGAGVKDTGTLFPGHGGVLDRMDSLLFAAPVMYHWLKSPISGLFR